MEPCPGRLGFRTKSTGASTSLPSAQKVFDVGGGVTERSVRVKTPTTAPPTVTLDAPFTSLDRTQNAINGPTKARWKEILNEVAQGVRPPYETWMSMTVHPPDPMVLPVWSADAFEVLPIEFWDLVFFYHRRLGVDQQYPCPRHGYKHARHTRTRAFRVQRLTRDGAANDSALQARGICCSECQRERAAATRAYELARSQDGVEAARIAKLKAAMDEVEYIFSARESARDRFDWRALPFYCHTLRVFIVASLCCDLRHHGGNCPVCEDGTVAARPRGQVRRPPNHQGFQILACARLGPNSVATFRRAALIAGQACCERC